MRSFFSHTRAEENAADTSGMRFMHAAGIDLQGAVQVMDLFRGQESLSLTRQDAYARTHPLSRDRFRRVRALAEAQAGKAEPDPEAEYWFARTKGKLSAFQRSPKWTLTRAGESGFEDVRLMREAVAHHRRSDLDRALPAIDGAIAQRPDDPYLHELRGQILMESRRIKAAVAAYARAANLAPRNALILGAYGRALLADGQVQRPRNSSNRPAPATGATSAFCAISRRPRRKWAIAAWPRCSRPNVMRWQAASKMLSSTPNAPAACCPGARPHGSARRI